MATNRKWYNRFLKNFNKFVKDPQITDLGEWDGSGEKYKGFNVSAEEGNLIDGIRAWDYYGETLGRDDPKTHHEMEAFLKKHNAFAEWYSPGNLHIVPA